MASTKAAWLGGLVFASIFTLTTLRAQTQIRILEEAAKPVGQDAGAAGDEYSRLPRLHLPVLSFVHDAAGESLRPMIGVPGSAMV